MSGSWVWAASCAGDKVHCMLSPKVIELRRGSAHSGASGHRLVKPSAGPVQPAVELRQLKYFVANGEDLHVRRAAERPLRLAA